jgi:hypothetical protein
MPRIHSTLAAERDCFGVRTFEVRTFGLLAFGARAVLAAREAETGVLKTDFLPGMGIGRFIGRQLLELLD